MLSYDHHIADHGRKVLITPPSAVAVMLADAKTAMGITDSSQDGLITAALDAAADMLDPAVGGWLGRALRPQTWELQLKSFGARRYGFVHPRYPHQAHAIVLPYPPLISVTSVKYLDVNGVDTTMAVDTDYRVLGVGQPYGKSYIAPPYAGAWPATRIDDASVRIRFQAGYADDTDPAKRMPRALRNAIILGARALMSMSTHDMTLYVDEVQGIGAKRYQNNPAATDAVKRAIGDLLVNLAIS